MDVQMREGEHKHTQNTETHTDTRGAAPPSVQTFRATRRVRRLLVFLSPTTRLRAAQTRTRISSTRGVLAGSNARACLGILYSSLRYPSRHVG